VPKARFEFADYDGERIVATSHIEEYEWRFGDRLVSVALHGSASLASSAHSNWNSARRLVPRRDHGRGARLVTAQRCFQSETPEAAFKRYCEKEHRSKYRKFQIRYIGLAPAQTVFEQR
jgi:hypothetical protein